MKLEQINVLGYEVDIEQTTLLSLYTLSFLVPLLIGHPQVLVGSTVNFLIVFSSLKFGFKRSIPLLLIPSLVATGSGLLFNGATLFLVYLMPFIMFSNGILSYFSSKFNSTFGVLAGVFLKVVFLYIATLLLTNVIGLPHIFLTSMGLLQLYTGLIGGGVGLVFFLLLSKTSKNV